MNVPDSRKRAAVRWPSSLLLVLLCAGPSAACTVDVAPMAFGSIDPIANADTDSVTTLTVTCPADTAYSATVSAGAGTYADRRMTGAQGALSYQIHTEASRSLVWGDGSGGTTALSGTAGPAGETRNLYGRVPAQPMAIPGSYSDTLLVTVTY